MKLYLIIALLLTLAAPSAFAGLADADESTEGKSGDVEMCLGHCEKDQNQVNFTTSPYEVDQKYKEIMTGRAKGVVTPEELQHGKAVKDEGQDI